jgi:pimeloyl-ACP methyl ester carboxylesterase
MEKVSCCRFQQFYKYLLLTRYSESIKITKRTAVDLAYKTQGNCPGQTKPILFLHGLLGSKRNWETISKNISSTLNTCTIAVDARNHGESPHDSSHTYPDLASDVSKLMDTLKLKQATIIGHSMGGRTGMVLALTEVFKFKLT